ncbi:hypothetical protein KCU93_g165, partial [Aureobasidium melanogenum]
LLDKQCFVFPDQMRALLRKKTRLREPFPSSLALEASEACDRLRLTQNCAGLVCTFVGDDCHISSASMKDSERLGCDVESAEQNAGAFKGLRRLNALATQLSAQLVGEACNKDAAKLKVVCRIEWMASLRVIIWGVWGLGGVSSGDCDLRGAVQQSFAAAIANTISMVDRLPIKRVCLCGVVICYTLVVASLVYEESGRRLEMALSVHSQSEGPGQVTLCVGLTDPQLRDRPYDKLVPTRADGYDSPNAQHLWREVQIARCASIRSRDKANNGVMAHRGVSSTSHGSIFDLGFPPYGTSERPEEGQ